MKDKKIKSKLSLNKKTIANLGGRQMNGIRGRALGSVEICATYEPGTICCTGTCGANCTVTCDCTDTCNTCYTNCTCYTLCNTVCMTFCEECMTTLAC